MHSYLVTTAIYMLFVSSSSPLAATGSARAASSTRLDATAEKVDDASREADTAEADLARLVEPALWLDCAAGDPSWFAAEPTFVETMLAQGFPESGCVTKLLREESMFTFGGLSYSR